MRKFSPHAPSIITMKKGMRFLLVLSLFCLDGAQADGQDKLPNNYSISVGTGLFYYVNTLKTQPDLVTKSQIGFSGRLMWEPEHRLSLGGEVGYYKIYNVKIDSGKSNSPVGDATLSAIPVLLCFRMRITPHIYFTGGQGFSVLISSINSFGNTIKSTQLSLADAQLSVVYRIPMSDRFRIESELKYLHFGKTQDFGFSLQAVATYMFRFKR